MFTEYEKLAVMELM